MLQPMMRAESLVVLVCGVAPVVVFTSLYLLAERRTPPAKRKRHSPAVGQHGSRGSPGQGCSTSLLLIGVRGLQGVLFLLMMAGLFLALVDPALGLGLILMLGFAAKGLDDFAKRLQQQAPAQRKRQAVAAKPKRSLPVPPLAVVPPSRPRYESPLGLVDDPEDERIEWAIMDDLDDWDDEQDASYEDGEHSAYGWGDPPEDNLAWDDSWSDDPPDPSGEWW
ncbi:MAG: hypothetical protein KBH93_00325 [Anaerolineae bacterium]|nr:hypothetical protein [Anaerolineae bacterium]